jgi:predicted nucleic acid-binding protein
LIVVDASALIEVLLRTPASSAVESHLVIVDIANLVTVAEFRRQLSPSALQRGLGANRV